MILPDQVGRKTGRTNVLRQLGHRGMLLNNEKHQRPEKNSWDEKRISAVKAPSHKNFSGRWCFSL